jgi:predicted nuclease with TOPRIM domain
MREQLQARLEELKREFETGQARLRELETQEARLRETMLRISGAIQVLEETLAGTQDASTPNTSMPKEGGDASASGA